MVEIKDSQFVLFLQTVPTTSATTTTARPTSRHTQRPTVVTTDPIVNTKQPVSYTQASYQYQTNATTTTHSGLDANSDSQQPGLSEIESGGTTGVVTGNIIAIPCRVEYIMCNVKEKASNL